MFLSYKYKPVRNTNVEIGIYIGQNKEKQKMCALEVCARGLKKVPKRSSMVPFLAENRLGTKMIKPRKQHSCCNYWLGCWTWTASKTTGKQYVLKKDYMTPARDPKQRLPIS